LPCGPFHFLTWRATVPVPLRFLKSCLLFLFYFLGHTKNSSLSAREYRPYTTNNKQRKNEKTTQLYLHTIKNGHRYGLIIRISKMNEAIIPPTIIFRRDSFSGEALTNNILSQVNSLPCSRESFSAHAANSKCYTVSRLFGCLLPYVHSYRDRQRHS